MGMFHANVLGPRGLGENPGQPLYTKEEMLAYARESGHPVSAWTFRDWIQVGLLGRADNHDWPGRGHGSGSVARWSQRQFALFQLVLARKQTSQIASNAPFCNLPVWKWLYWGAQGGVSLEQVKRALGTWQRWYQNNSRKERSIRKHLWDIVARSASPHAVGKRDLVNTLATAALAGQSFDEASLQEMFALIIDPKGTGEARGPQGREITPEYLGRRLTLQGKAADLNLKEVPDPLWELARVGLLLARERYQVAQAEQEARDLSADERRFPRASLRALIDPSCFLLLDILALLQRGVHPQVQANLHPRAWLSGEATASIESASIPQALLLPNGSPLYHLHIDVTVLYKNNPWTFSFTLPYI